MTLKPFTFFLGQYSDYCDYCDYCPYCHYLIILAGLLLQVGVVPEQLVHPTGEGEEDEEVEEGELQDVDHHSAEGDLEHYSINRQKEIKIWRNQKILVEQGKWENL